jgi:hypothetical protein
MIGQVVYASVTVSKRGILILSCLGRNSSTLLPKFIAAYNLSKLFLLDMPILPRSLPPF